MEDVLTVDRGISHMTLAIAGIHVYLWQGACGNGLEYHRCWKPPSLRLTNVLHRGPCVKVCWDLCRYRAGWVSYLGPDCIPRTQIAGHLLGVPYGPREGSLTGPAQKQYGCVGWGEVT